MAHHLLVKDVITGTVFMAMEDTRLSGTDNDYNDNIYMVTVPAGSVNQLFIVRYLVVECRFNGGVACRFAIENGSGLVTSATITTAPSTGLLYLVDSTGTRATNCVNCLGGSLTLVSQWQLEYVPPSGNTVIATGFAEIVLSVSESSTSYTEYIRIDTFDVTPVSAPTAQSQSVSLTAGQSITITLGGSDSAGSQLTAVIASVPPLGTLQQYVTPAVTISASGTTVLDAVRRVTFSYPAVYLASALTTSFTFTLSNSKTSAAATVSITINPIPNVVPSTSWTGPYTTPEDTGVVLQFSATDSDGYPSAVQVWVYGPPNGVLYQYTGSVGAQITATSTTAAQVTQSSGTWRVWFVPSANWNGVQTISWYAFDGLAQTAGSGAVTVSAVNDAPVATAQSLTTLETVDNTGAPLSITLAGTDVEDGTVTSFQIASLPSAASGTLYAGGVAISSVPFSVSSSTALTFRPVPYTYGSVSFGFNAVDSASLVSTSAALVTITVTHVNHSPTAVAVTASTTKNVAVATAVRGTDPDSIDTLTLTITGLAVPVGASLVWGVAGTNFASGSAVAVGHQAVLPVSGSLAVAFSPVPYTFGTVSNIVTYRVADNGSPALSSTSGSLSVTVTYTNTAPTIGTSPGSPLAANEDSYVDVVLTATDLDIPTEATSFVVTALPARGVLSLSGSALVLGSRFAGPTATIRFTPTALTFGTNYASFSVLATDGAANSTAAVMSVDVAHVNHVPTATALSGPVSTNMKIPVTFSVSGTDLDSFDVLTLRVNVTGLVGTLSYGGSTLSTGSTVSGGTSAVRSWSLTYAPPVAIQYGTPFTAFSFVVLDNTGAVSPGTVTVTINVAQVINTPTTGWTPNPFSLPEEGLSYVTLSGSDDQGYGVSLVLASVPAGTVFSTTGSGPYTLGAQLGAGSVVASGTGSVSAVVAYRCVQSVSQLGVSRGANLDFFDFSVLNEDFTATSQVTVTVTDVNYSPAFASTPSQLISQSLVSQTVSFPFSASDPDPQDVLSASVVSLPAQGTLFAGSVALLAGSAIPLQGGLWSVDVVVEPLAVGVPYASFVVAVTDGEFSVEATLTLGISDTNFAPEAVSVAPVTLDEDTSVVVTLEGTDVDGDALVGEIVDVPSVGGLVDEESGAAVSAGDILTGSATAGTWRVRYTPPVLTHGAPLASFSFRVWDGALYSGVQTVVVSVNHVNHAPAIAGHAGVDLFEVPSGNVLPNITLEASDVDAGDALSLVVAVLPTRGSLLVYDSGSDSFVGVSGPGAVVGADAVLQFVPVAFTHSDGGVYASFEMQAFDGNAYSAATSVELRVAHVNHAPVAGVTAYTFTTAENVSVAVVIPAAQMSDPDAGDVVRLLVRTVPSKGVLLWEGAAVAAESLFDAQGGSFVFSYEPDFLPGVEATYGAPFDGFTAVASDGELESAEISVAIDVLNRNFPPTGVPVRSATNQSEPVTAVLGGGEDLDAEDVLMVIIKSLPTGGTLTLVGGGSVAVGTVVGAPYGVVYTPQASFSGDDVFLFAVWDGQAESAEYTCTVAVFATGNQEPLIVGGPGSFVVQERGSQALVLSGVDPNGDQFFPVVVSLPARGTVFLTNGQNDQRIRLVAPGALPSSQLTFVYVADLYEPAGPNFETLVMVLSDGRLNSTAGSYNFTITNTNFAPEAEVHPNPYTIIQRARVLVTLGATDDDEGDVLRAQITDLPGRGRLYVPVDANVISAEGPFRLLNATELPFTFGVSVGRVWYVEYVPEDGARRRFDQFFYRVQDQAGVWSTELQVSFDVLGVNRPPVLRFESEADQHYELVQGASTRFSGLNVTDADANELPLAVTISCKVGTVFLQQTQGLSNILYLDDTDTPLDELTVQSAVFQGTQKINFTGSQHDVGAALSGYLLYQSTELGDDIVLISVNDLGNRGLGGPLSGEAEIQISVVAGENADGNSINVVPISVGAATGAAAFLIGSYFVFKKHGIEPVEPLFDAKESHHVNPLYQSQSRVMQNPLYGLENMFQNPGFQT
eukprot:TRINITY_DN103_c0_g1_i1.p1 TRINITY_DN103_c0_g1~~TRINITY_DN103_c0_g1_i1.p1  ORF type:complete len:2287 (+),score=550.68 TRINITY_DN103_c0_g1_i1:850-6861(+)